MEKDCHMRQSKRTIIKKINKYADIFKLVCNIQVITGEEVVTQHQLLVTDMKWKFVKQTKKTFTPKLRTWKLKDQNVTNLFKDRLTHLLASDINEKSVVDQ